MSALQLVQSFEDRTDFPVLIDEVRDEVIRLSGVSDIAFKATDIDKDILRGLCYFWEPSPAPYAEARQHVDILYAATLDPAWRRLVIVKELIHILDKEAHRIAAEGDLNDLIRRMSRRPELRDPMNWHEASDKVGLFQALGILFPFAARQLIKPKYDDGLLAEEMIAHRAGIPDTFVSFLMSDDWTQYYEGFMSLCEADPGEPVRVKAANAG